jgi:hypothetical protein
MKSGSNDIECPSVSMDRFQKGSMFGSSVFKIPFFLPLSRARSRILLNFIHFAKFLSELS